jgi:hypothetical protein
VKAVTDQLFVEDFITEIVEIHFSTPKAVFANDDLYTENGRSLLTAAFAPAQTAASGLGVTVVSRNGHVAFGKPAVGDPCFIAVSGNIVERGVMVKGKLQWTQVGEVPNTNSIDACSFAGEAFFIGYAGGDDGGARLGVSRNGKSFTWGIDPFPGAAPHGAGSGWDRPGDATVSAGFVAYNPKAKLYVTTGSYLRNVLGFFDAGGPHLTPWPTMTQALASSVSSGGFGWSPAFNDAEIGIFGAGSGCTGGDGKGHNVAFGNGVFVACAVRNVAFISGSLSTQFGVVLTGIEAAAAVSSNGRNWSARPLPGVRKGDAVSTGSTTRGVVFCKGKRGGFFLMAAEDFASNFPAPGSTFTPKLFYSTDGSGWTPLADEKIRTYFSVINRQKKTSTIVYKG